MFVALELPVLCKRSKVVSCGMQVSLFRLTPLVCHHCCSPLSLGKDLVYNYCHQKTALIHYAC